MSEEAKLNTILQNESEVLKRLVISKIKTWSPDDFEKLINVLNKALRMEQRFFQNALVHMNDFDALEKFVAIADKLSGYENLREAIANGFVSTKDAFRILNSNLLDLIDLQTIKDLVFVREFFMNAERDYVIECIERGVNHSEIIKRFYDDKLRLQVAIPDAQNILIRSNKFSFHVKRMIIDALNNVDEPKIFERMFRLVMQFDDDFELEDSLSSLQNVCENDNIFVNVTDKKRLIDAINIIKYNLQNFKPDLSFENLTWIVDLLIVSTDESQNLIKNWVHAVQNDEECEKLQPIIISLISCESLTEMVCCRKISVNDAVDMYNYIREKIMNVHLSSQGYVDALNIAVSEYVNVDNICELINLIRDDAELYELKPFLRILSTVKELPKVIRKNNFTLTDVLPIALKLYYMSASDLITKFDFETLKEIVKLLELCKRDEIKIERLMQLLLRIEPKEFNYCKAFLLELSDDDKMLNEIKIGKSSVNVQIAKFYRKRFQISKVSRYILKIIATQNFNFDTIKSMEKLIINKTTVSRQALCDALLSLSSDEEYNYAKHYLTYHDSFGNNIIDSAKQYYASKIPDAKMLNNINLSFESLSEAIKIIKSVDATIKQKAIRLIENIKSDPEFDMLKQFIPRLVDLNMNINNSLTVTFHKMIYQIADDLGVRKIFNNKLVSLSNKIMMLDFVKSTQDESKRFVLSDVFCLIQSDSEFEEVYPFFNRLSDIKQLPSIIHENNVIIQHLIQFCKLGIDRLLAANNISFENVKRVVEVINSERDPEKIVLVAMIPNNDEEFERMLPFITKMNQDVANAIINNEITLSNACVLYEFNAEKLLNHNAINFETKNAICDLLSDIKDKQRRAKAIDALSSLDSDSKMRYVFDFLSSAEEIKTDKPYINAARDFYIQKLAKKYPADIVSRLKILSANIEFGHEILERMASKLSKIKDEKQRKILFDQLLKGNLEAHVESEIAKPTLSDKMKKATEGAESFNSSADANSNFFSGFDGADSDIEVEEIDNTVYSDDVLDISLMDDNAVTQFKNHKLVIMTEEIYTEADDVTNKLKASAKRINRIIAEKITETTKFMDDFKTYLDANGDEASIQFETDNEDEYLCLISKKELEVLLNDLKNFIDIHD